VRGVRRFEDLDAYKLAVQLRREICTLSCSGKLKRDYKFTSQIRDAARGGPRNISEGFSRFVPSEFHQFLSYAKASIDETKNHIYDGHESGYFNDDERHRLLTLVDRTLAALSQLMRYLESPEAKRAYKELCKRRGTSPYSPRNPNRQNQRTDEP